MGTIQAAAALGVTFPEEITSALEAHEKIQAGGEFYIRLIDAREMREMVEALQDIEVFRHLLPLWTDDQSNYYAVYYEGPMRGRVCYLNHEETDNSPVFRSIPSLIRRLEENPQADAYELTPDYPPMRETEAERVEEDLTAIRGLRERLAAEEPDDDVRCQLLMSLMALTPYERLDELLPYFEDEDPYVQERAEQIFKHHGTSPGQWKRERTDN